MNIEEWLDDSLGRDIWRKKYCYNNSENFEDWLERISAGDPEIKDLILHKKFLFGGRVLANRGLNQEKVTLSNCYCLPVEDNLESIFQTAGEIARTYSYGGGCGLTLSNISPAGIYVNNAAKSSSGAISFAELFDLTTGLIGQEGRR